MKLLKLIPAAAIVFTAFLPFEAKAGYPSGWTKKTSCTVTNDMTPSKKYYKLQKTDTPASYGVYSDKDNDWVIENVSYNCATNWYQYECGKGWSSGAPTCG